MTTNEEVQTAHRLLEMRQSGEKVTRADAQQLLPGHEEAAWNLYLSIVSDIGQTWVTLYLYGRRPKTQGGA